MDYDEAVKYLTYKGPEAEKELPKTELPNTPTLYVFRHGQSEDNAKMIFSGWRDTALTDEGRTQAEALAEKLKDKNIQMLISSDQQRTIETMKIAMSKNEYAKGLEIIQDGRLRERNYGDWQGKSKLEMQMADPEGLKKVRRGWNGTPPNGESMADIDKRVSELLDEIVPQMKANKISVAIACSGNSIRPIRKRFEGLSEEEAATVETPTGKDYAAYPIK
jgi:broad specificity phosphatase PhoE